MGPKEILMDFNTETRVRDIVATNPGATHVLEDAGVDYCCGGEKSLRDACVNAGTSAEEILSRLRDAARQVRPEYRDWMSAPLAEITEHIRAKHHAFVRQSIQRVRAMLVKVKAKHAANHPETITIETAFGQLAMEMIAHMQKEEQILFPYIGALERAAIAAEPLELPFFQSVRNPVGAMMKEHDSAGELVKQIRTASNDYNAPPDACPTFEALYRELSEFEADLHQHVHLENNILFPRAVELEAAVDHQE
jgi:regulator of cell morphogenesis and NO signaling